MTKLGFLFTEEQTEKLLRIMCEMEIEFHELMDLSVISMHNAIFGEDEEDEEEENS